MQTQLCIRRKSVEHEACQLLWKSMLLNPLTNKKFLISFLFNYFGMVLDIKDPEHPYSLEELKEITEDAIEVDDQQSYYGNNYWCLLASKTLRSLPSRYKVSTLFLIVNFCDKLRKSVEHEACQLLWKSMLLNPLTNKKFLISFLFNYFDPEHPYSLEELKEITEDAIEVDDQQSYYGNNYWCLLASKTLRSLPSRYKVSTLFLIVNFLTNCSFITQVNVFGILGLHTCIFILKFLKLFCMNM
ncbi:protein ae7 [Quercus suber]|uniref:Protein ae7 n=1 Tax=Quercus suber TaxID=58331 RepID=A0AAW0M3M9_QUESU